MRIDRALPLKLLWLVYGVMWIGGVLRLPDTGWAAPLFLFVAGGIALVSERSQRAALLSAAAIGFVFELIGLRTGFPFGRYIYTGTLAPALLGVPIAIGCAWLTLFAFVRQWTTNIWIGAGLFTATDLLIDPVASGVLGYWRWTSPGPYFGVPLTNFAGWYLVCVLIFVLNRKPSATCLSHRILGATILLFFLARAI